MLQKASRVVLIKYDKKTPDVSAYAGIGRFSSPTGYISNQRRKNLFVKIGNVFDRRV